MSKPKGEGYDVICQNCNGIFYETTKKYDSTKVTDATMLRLKEPYRSWNWQELPPDDSIVCEALTCPEGAAEGCGAPLSTSEYVIVKEQEKPIDNMSSPPLTIETLEKARNVVSHMEVHKQEATIGDPESITVGSTPIEDFKPDVTTKEPITVVPQKPVSDLDTNYPDNAGKGKWICIHCQRELKNPAALSAHLRWCKKKPGNK